MNGDRLRQWGALGVLFGLFNTYAHAQGVVLFGNFNLPRTNAAGATVERRVLLPNFAGASGTNYIAQLLYENNAGIWVAHPDTARFFSSSSTQLAGYWQGANRTLVNAGGPSPSDPSRGIPVQLQVRVWDGGFGVAPLTFEEARAQGKYSILYPLFPYVEELDSPPSTDDKWMRNFMGGTGLLTPLYPRLQSVSRTSGGIRFGIEGNGGALIAIETKTNLNTAGSWIPLVTNYPPFSFTNTTTDADQRYFRAVYR